MASLGSSFWTDVKQFLSLGVPFDEGLQAARGNLGDAAARLQVDGLLEKIQSGEIKGDWLGAVEGVIPEAILASLSSQKFNEPMAMVDSLLSAWKGQPGEAGQGLGARLLDPLKWLSKNLSEERESLLTEVNTWLEKDGVKPDIPSRNDRLRALLERLIQASVLEAELAVGDESELRYGEQREELSAQRGAELLRALRAAGRPRPLGPGERWSCAVEVDGQARQCEVVACRFGATTRVRLRLVPPEPVYPWHETLGSSDQKACEELLRANTCGVVGVLGPAAQLPSMVRGLCALAAGLGRRTVCVERTPGSALGKAWPLAWSGAWDDPTLAELLRAQQVEVLGLCCDDSPGLAPGLARLYAGKLLLLGAVQDRREILRQSLGETRIGGWVVQDSDALRIEP